MLRARAGIRFVSRFGSYNKVIISRLASQRTMSVDKKDNNGKWNSELTAEQLWVLRDKGTEPANTGKYLYNKRTGVYHCANCDSPLYNSGTKFESGCGWPSFNEEIEGALKYETDTSHGMERTEICCRNCGGHLGHVFTGEGWNKRLGLPQDARHCVNSLSLKFKSDNEEKIEVK